MKPKSTHFGESLALRHSIYTLNPGNGHLCTEISLELCYNIISQRLAHGLCETTVDNLTFTLIKDTHNADDTLTVLEGYINEEDFQSFREAFQGTAEHHLLEYYDLPEDDSSENEETTTRRSILIPLNGELGFRIFLKRFDALFQILLSKKMESEVGTYAKDITALPPANN